MGDESGNRGENQSESETKQPRGDESSVYLRRLDAVHGASSRADRSEGFKVAGHVD